MNDEADACRVRNAALRRLLCDNGINAPHICRIHKSEECTLCRTRRPLPILIVPDEGKQLCLVRMIVDVADERAADCALRALDIDTKPGAAHERDLLRGEPRLEPVEIVTNGAVRHIQQPCKCAQLQRLVHEQACRQYRAPQCGRKLALRIHSGVKAVTQSPQILRIAREHKARARAPEKCDAVRYQCHLEPVHLTRNGACTDIEGRGDALGGYIAVC